MLRSSRLIAVVPVVLVLTACTHRRVDDLNAFSWSEELPPGSVLHIRTGDGHITVSESPGASVHIVGSRHWQRGRARDIQFQVTRRGDQSDVYVCAMWRASGRCNATGYRGKRTDTFLSFFSLFHRTTDATASFMVSVPPGVTVDAKTTHGTVSISRVRAGVRARSVVGSIVAMNVGGPLDLATTTGNIQLSVDSLAGADTIKAITVTGLVRAELPAGTEGDFDLSAVRGSVRTDFPLPAAQYERRGHSTIVGRVGSGARLVKLHTVTGSVAAVKTASSNSMTPAPALVPQLAWPTPVPATAPAFRRTR